MNSPCVPKATLGRLPAYLRYLKTISEKCDNVSSTAIAKAMGYGEVQVRKDLAAVSGKGKPKIGYEIAELIAQLEHCLGQQNKRNVVLIGAGKLGMALLDYEGFADYGLEISAAFDTRVQNRELSQNGKPILPMNELSNFCRQNNTTIGILAVPKNAAQEVCDTLVQSGITSVWSFAPVNLIVPDGVFLRQENLALSLAYLSRRENEQKSI